MADGLSANAAQSGCLTGSDDTANVEQKIADVNDSVDVATDFSVKTWKEDLELVVEGRRLFVASSVLALVSPVFTSMFENTFKDNGPRVIELSDERYDDVVVFLCCIYPNILREICHENLAVILRLATKYDVKLLRNKCEQFLIGDITKETTPKDICTYLIYAARYKLDCVRNKCLDIAANMSRRVLEEAEKLRPLPSDIVSELQGKVMKSMEETIVTLSKRVDQLNAKCHDLQDITKSFWAGDTAMLALREADIEKVTFTIPNASTFTTFKSPVYRISGKDISCKVIEGDGDYVTFHIAVEQLPDLHDWSCKLYGKLRILNHKNPNSTQCKSIQATFSAANLTQVLLCIQRQALIKPGNGYITDDVLHIEVYLLVDSTLHKIKKSVLI